MVDMLIGRQTLIIFNILKILAHNIITLGQRHRNTYAGITTLCGNGWIWAMDSIPCGKYLGGNGLILVPWANILLQISVYVIHRVFTQRIICIQGIDGYLQGSIDIAKVGIKIELQQYAITTGIAFGISWCNGVGRREVFQILHNSKLGGKVARNLTIGFGVVDRTQIWCYRACLDGVQLHRAGIYIIDGYTCFKRLIGRWNTKTACVLCTWNKK